MIAERIGKREEQLMAPRVDTTIYYIGERRCPQASQTGNEIASDLVENPPENDAG
jgi:hypothetical protein